MWTSRGQVQTAADAGALAGAISLAFDSPTDFAGAKTKARAVARANSVWGRGAGRAVDGRHVPAVSARRPGPARHLRQGGRLPQSGAAATRCRCSSATSSASRSQGVRATATAQIVTGDTTDCLKPWAILDRWDEFAPDAEPDYPNPDPDFGPTSTYDKYSTGRGIPRRRKTISTRRHARRLDRHRVHAARRPGPPVRREGRRPSNSVSSGWFRAIRLPRARRQDERGNVYRDNITTCSGLPSSYAAPGTVCPADIGSRRRGVLGDHGCFA